MNKRVAKKVLKNKENLAYHKQQIERAEARTKRTEKNAQKAQEK
ncbi:MAG: hypothetical protein AAF740_02225 [Bacteroidota bacterium]